VADGPYRSAVPYTLLKGSYVIRYPDLPRQGPQPDGDTVKFLPDTPALVEALPRPSGKPPDINARGISIRLEAIDALETHFDETHQELVGANRARDELLARLGFTNVTFYDDLPNNVASADQDSVGGHLLTNGVDANGRIIGFVYAGEHDGPDGDAIFLDNALVDRSINAALLAAGLVYPAFYSTLPASLREHLSAASTAARAAGDPAGIWPRSTADPDGPATVGDLAGLEQLVIWPKLFRRVVPYLAAGFTDFDAFDAWLRADPINRDDAIFRLDTLEHGNLHDVIDAAGSRIRLTVWPESFVITPDPPPVGGTTEPAAIAGDVLVVAALPDPLGTDRGHETVTLLNSAPATVTLTGWSLAASGGGRRALDGTLAAGATLLVKTSPGLQLGNKGGTIVLVDASGTTIDMVSYGADAVRPGRTVCFGR
jgi:hypothetical protein